MLKMRDVCISFDQKLVLDHLTFEVESGEIFGFLGPSGAGKTTTIKLLTKQLNKDAGEIAIFGQRIEDVKGDLFEEIGILSDMSSAYERFSIEENLQFFADLHEVEKSEVEKLLKEVDLYEDRKKKFNKLSKGMKQRVILSCAIIHHPKMLFLDEPTSGLDPVTTKKVHELLMELNAQGTTIFLTTHNMEEADKLCDRVAFLNNGKIMEMGEPEILKIQYAKDIVVVRFDKETIEIDKSADSLKSVANRIENEKLISIHSKEPTLEEIFLEVTGRELS